MQVSWRERALLAEAAAALLGARAMLLVLPFRTLAARLGTFVQTSDSRVAVSRVPGPAEQQRIASEVHWAVTRAAAHVPFRAVCFPQAIAAHAMLRRRGIAGVIHYGARTGGENAMDAHAWLDAAGVEVTGYPLPSGIREIGCFV